MNTFIVKIIFISLLLITNAHTNIQLIKKENSDSNTTLLIIAGVHGDEPGGYFAASILATHYDIKSKNLWIVPNLNQKSIQEDSRGIYGDMNRKFSAIDKGDKDANIIKEIKEIILSKNVSLVLNLHDGHGFYRKENHGKIFNPTAWGQTCVIDQCSLNQNQPFGNLNNIASTVKNNMNKKLLEEHHSFNVKNTKTKFDDEEMQLSLTYFAVTNNKPAFAIESSKNLSSLSQKVFYQLLAIEEFMNIMEISYTKKFELNESNLGDIIKGYGILGINDNILLNLSNIKKNLSYIPIKSKGNVFKFSNPLGSIKSSNGKFIVYIGNKSVTTLKPQFFKSASDYAKKFDAIIDGKTISFDNTSEIFVFDDFNIVEQADYRVNVIGYTSVKKKSESGIDIKLRDLNKRFSIDNNNKVYRVEFYKNDEFCFMSKIHFK
ncbi:succinylglutamate desuccinylase/aspartoacylase family protein [Candidatus Sulfurimonas marisnigri]|uniref:Succinylglutamate desuccinylase/aspartoacylase family protein n=1 Tax=Candidatus Sulfurimonas marisnigri TaxID=2740405 RepID=A0A7S7LYT8_9BACT|nr:M99 family carboxypeptidase catalytic domain-containing protein [Candidatus Sulfurimonas marisnigri]QOY53931.1 succinylglutamate desuccinylase/aspartoacylase family protein [Candidatus Sulfurimonas marisnigri]